MHVRQMPDLRGAQLAKLAVTWNNWRQIFA
jgi:hypothetical protein